MCNKVCRELVKEWEMRSMAENMERRVGIPRIIGDAERAFVSDASVPRIPIRP